MQRQDIKDTVQYCLSEDVAFLKMFGANFSLVPMGSTTAGFTKGGKDFFTTFGSYQVEGKKQQRAVISLVATHDGLQTLELHFGEDEQRDIAILSLPKPKQPSQQQPQPIASDKPKKLPAAASTTNKEQYQDEISSQATPATMLDTATTACDIDDDDDSDSDDTSSLQEARGRLPLRVQPQQKRPSSLLQRPASRASSVSVNEKVQPSSSQVPPRGKNRAMATAPIRIPLEIKTESTHQDDSPVVSKIPLEIDTVSLGKKNGQNNMPDLMNDSKPLDDTYNSDEDDEDEEEDENDDNDDDDDDDDDSSNPFASSDDDFDVADDDDESSDDDSDARDVRCQQRRMSAGYGNNAFPQ